MPRLTLSGRQDWARQEANSGGAQHDSKFTYRVGALYKTDLGIAPYITYSTSFQPQAALPVDGSLAKPSLGRQIKGGVKYPFAVNASNFFDKHYLTGCYVNYNWCWYGSGRTVEGTINYNF